MATAAAPFALVAAGGFFVLAIATTASFRGNVGGAPWAWGNRSQPSAAEDSAFLNVSKRDDVGKLFDHDDEPLLAHLDIDMRLFHFHAFKELEEVEMRRLQLSECDPEANTGCGAGEVCAPADTGTYCLNCDGCWDEDFCLLPALGGACECSPVCVHAATYGYDAPPGGGGGSSSPGPSPSNPPSASASTTGSDASSDGAIVLLPMTPTSSPGPIAPDGASLFSPVPPTGGAPLTAGAGADMGTSVPVPDGPTVGAGNSVPAPAPFFSENGIEIKRCEDTLAIFGDSDEAKAFFFAVSCSCEGDLSTAFTMACRRTDHCYNYTYPETFGGTGRACSDITYAYDFEIDEGSGRLLSSGFVSRRVCTTFLSGNGPGTGSSRLCKVSNPQCEAFLRREEGLSKRNAAVVCSQGQGCYDFFADMGHGDETASNYCPTTFLDGAECKAGANRICGIGSPGSIDPDADASDAVYVATADCSNVVPCATSACEESVFDPLAIAGAPVYPRCIVPAPEYEEDGSSIEGEGESIDLYVSEVFLKHNNGTGTLAAADDVCRGICDSDPSSGCVMSSRSFYVQGFCYPVASIARGLARGSKVYYTNGTRHCTRRYSDQHCQARMSKWDTCEEIEEVEACGDSAVRWKIMRSQCIESSGPTGDFVVPLVRYRSFPSVEDCQTFADGDASLFTQFHSPDAPTLCQAGRYEQKDLGNPMLPGGVRTYCDPDTGKFTSEFFSNGDCTRQDAENMYRVFGSIPESCGPPSFPELTIPGIIMDSTGCKPDEVPEYYCKDLASSGFGIGITAPETSPPTPTPQQTIDLILEMTTTGPTQKLTQQTSAGAGTVGWGFCFYLVYEAIAMYVII